MRSPVPRAYSTTPPRLARSGFPTSVAAAPLPAFPLGAIAPLRSLYIRPGDSSYYNQFFPTNVLDGYQTGLWNPYSEQWSIGIERQLLPRWVLARRLCRLAHVEDQPSTGCRSALAVRPHRAGSGSHGAGRQLHSPVLDLVVSAE